MNQRKKYLAFHILLTVAGALSFIPFLGAVHLFDWDEINFAECAREMIVSGDYSRVQLNFQPFWEKPPLFIWLQVISMKIFGITDFAARFPNAVCGILTLNLLYYFGRKYNNHKFGLLWALCYTGSFLPFLYFKSGIIDPWFNLFIFLSICFLLQWFNANQKEKINSNAFYAGLFAGLAMLTKGPAALLIIGLTFLVSWIRLKLKPFSDLKSLVVFIATLLITGFSWFLLEIVAGHYDIVKEFIVYQVRLFNTHDSDHEGFLLYHFVILLIGCFPASVFFIPSHHKNNNDASFQLYIKKWMLHLFWVVLILFTIVQTKIAHYSSMCYMPLTYLAAYTIYHMIYSGKVFPRWLLYISLFISIVSGIAFIAAGSLPYYKDYFISHKLIKDDFALACLQTPAQWRGYEWMIGLLFLPLSVYFLVSLRKNYNKLYSLFGTTLVTVWLITIMIVPRIEPYTQGPAIEFYESLKDKDCYVETLGFKSYAYLYYTNRRPSHNSKAMLAYIEQNEKQAVADGHAAAYSFGLYSMNWMLFEPIDKPAYFVGRINDEEYNNKNYPDKTELYRKGGFIFYVRNPKQ